MQESKHDLCLFISITTQRLPRSPVNSTNAQEANLGKEKKNLQEFIQKPWEKQLEVQLQGKHFCAKMEKDVPANHGADNSALGRWGEHSQLSSRDFRAVL